MTAPVPKIVGSGRHSARRGRPPRRRRVSGRVLALAVAVLLVVAGAFGAWQFWHRGDTGGSAADNGSTSGPGVAPLGAVASIAERVPADIRASGRLVIGVNVPYAPNEFKNSDGQLVGFDVELMNAVARTLGLTPDYRVTAFDTIIPSVQGGEFDVGMSSFTDTKEREAMVDFVTYFQAGTLWAQRAGASIDPQVACGVRVGVVTDSLQATEQIPAKSDACVAAGVSPIDMVVLDGQDEVTSALIAGKVDAMAADSPVTGFAIKLSAGALVPAGEVFASAPYGWPVAKGSPLAESLRQALEHLMQTGEYKTIATIWGVEKGLVGRSVINGAIG